MFSLPNYLKTQGYQTAAVHCFWAKYWSRDTAIRIWVWTPSSVWKR